MSKNISSLSGKKDFHKNLFEEIGVLAQNDGTPDVEALEKLAEEFLIGKANVYGSASFYDFTRTENKGKKIYTCNGSACLTAGTQKALKEKINTRFSAEEMGEMCCLGRCHENRAFHYAGKNYSGTAIDSFEEILNEKNIKKDNYHVDHSGTSILTHHGLTLEDADALLKKILHGDAGKYIEEIKTSGLRGRGGAGFPMSFKLESCRKENNRIKFIVCNADEGDPGAYSDRYLMEEQPQLVLLGMVIAGYLAGAEYGVIYIRGEYPESILKIQDTILEFEDRGWIGRNIFLSQFSFQFKV